jgi:hypothetical protein
MDKIFVKSEEQAFAELGIIKGQKNGSMNWPSLGSQKFPSLNINMVSSKTS